MLRISAFYALVGLCIACMACCVTYPQHAVLYLFAFVVLGSLAIVVVP